MLLRTLVRLARKDQLGGPIIPYPTGRPAEYAIYVRGAASLLIRGTYNLDMLCEAGVLGARWDRFGQGRIYLLTAESFVAVDANFADVTLPAEPAFDFDPQAIFHAMSGGELLPDVLARLPAFRAAPDHVARRDAWIDGLVDALLAAVKPQLPLKQRVAYDAAARELRTMVKGQVVETGRLNALFTHLAFLAHDEQPAALTQRAWPYLYLLRLMINTRPDVG